MISNNQIEMTYDEFNTPFKKHIILYIYIMLMLGMMFLKNACGISISPVLYLLLTATVIVWGDVTDIISVFLCFIPFSSGFQFKYGVLICCIALLRRGKFAWKWKNALPVYLMIGWELLHVAEGQRFSYNEFLRDFAELFFLGILLCMDVKNLNYKTMIRALSLSVVGVVLIIFYIQISNFGFNIDSFLSAGSSSFRFGQDTTENAYGLNFNANRLGIICTLSLVGQLFLLCKKKTSVFDIILLGCSVAFGFLTLSRAYTLTVFFVILYYIYAIGGDKRNSRFINLFIFLFIGFIVFMLLRSYLPQVFNNIIERFNEDDVSGGRVNLMEFYWEHIFSSVRYFIFGIGLQDVSDKMNALYVHIGVPHNNIQDIWVVWGIVGVGLVVYLIAHMISISLTKWNAETKILFMPLFTLLFTTIGGQFIRSEIVLMGLSFAYLILKYESAKQIDYNRR